MTHSIPRDHRSWSEYDADRFVEILRATAPGPTLAIVGIDGRGGAGKSTLAYQLAAGCSGTAVVHTDDIAWHHSFFGWDSMLATNVLQPVRAGRLPISFTPHAWVEHNRTGAITVPPETTLLLVEGTGSTRRSLTAYYHATIWVDADHDTAMARLHDRDKDPPGFIDDWMTEENALLSSDQPWTYATFQVSGTHSGHQGRLVVRST